MTTKPGVPLQEVQFAERPHIVHRGGSYYLRYRVAVEQGSRISLRMVVDAKITNDRGYYFFIAPISQPERGNLIERSLASDGLAEFARRRVVYWLNPDGTEIPLDIEEEPEQVRE